MFTNALDVRQYMLAGKATLTLQSQKTGAHFTYSVKRVPDYRGQQVDRWFVSLLTGPDNTSSYTYMGILDGTNGATEFRRTAKSRLSEDAPSVRGFQFMWKAISNDTWPCQMEIRHEGKCGRCGRKLTVPESLDRGIGPECAGHLH